MDLDFGYGQNINNNDVSSEKENGEKNDITNLDTGKLDNAVNNKEPVENINNDTNETIEKNKTKEADTKENEQNDINTNLKEGDSIVIGNDTYKIDKDGNVVDANGNIYKEASEVKRWLETFDNVDETNDNDKITIDAIKNIVGIEITGDDDKPIEFENSPAGIKSYIDAVVDSYKKEHYETAINTLYHNYPILNDVLNYYIANGNSLDGFGQLPDRSGITIDEDNVAQQEAIIRTAWEERKQKGDVQSYIDYLKSSGTLYATAKEELIGLQESDKEYREQLAIEAENRENARLKDLENYWNGVHEVIKTRNIAGYQIPDSIIINRNGQKISVTPEDFFNYIYRVDGNGKSAYEKDLEQETFETRRDDEILRAYLKFVGGNYSNLVGMAINNEKVKTLKLKAKERNSNSIRIIKSNANAKSKELDFGYN